jgi:hypothetical protein
MGYLGYRMAESAGVGPFAAYSKPDYFGGLSLERGQRQTFDTLRKLY